MSGTPFRSNLTDTSSKIHSKIQEIANNSLKVDYNDMKTFKITFALSLCLLLAGIFAGCADKSHVRRRGDGTITLVLQAPAMESGNAMRQMSADQESAVSADKLYVLVFKTTSATGAPLDEPNEEYAYTAKVASVTRLTDKNQYEAKIRLKADDASTSYRLVLITNCDFDPTALSAGMTKAQVFASASLKKAFTDKWPTDANARIPMWGESNTQRIEEGVTFGDCKDASSTNKIHLVRSLARVDVGLNFGADFNSETATPNGQTPFKLQSVRVYRMANSFMIPGTQSNTFHMDGTTKKPLTVLPDGVKMAADTKPLVFDQVSDPEKATVREIYIPERDKGTNRTDRPCLVIGGVYGSDTKPTYYRLDFIKKPTPASPKDQAEALDILRNHRYRFNITKVTGPGSDTPEDALITEPINIAFDVVVWNDGEIGEIRYDGQYYLAVNKDKFEFGKSEGDDAFTVRTNWEGGYKFVDASGNELPKTKAEAEAQNKWYYLSDPKDPAFVKDKDFGEKIFVLENATGAARTSADNAIYVQAGRIKWPLKINQSNKIAVYIRLYEQVDGQRIPTNLVEMTKGETKTVEVEYTPGANLDRRETDSGSQFIWTRKDDGSVPGKAVYEITADESRITDETFNLIDVSRFVADLQGITASADLTVTLTNYNAIPYRDRAFTVNMLRGEGNTYLLDDNNQFFFIKANAPYKVEVLDITTAPKGYQKKVVRGWDSWPKTVFTDDTGHLTGDKHVFLPYDYVAGSDGSTVGAVQSATVKLKITPTDSNKHFDAKEFTISLFSAIIQPTANCYIIKRGSTIPILIPVSEQINKAAEWYAEYEEVMESTVELRKDATGMNANGISKAAHDKYVNEKKSYLDRLEANEDSWDVGYLWSTISSNGKTPGIKCKKVQLDGYRQRNYMSVELENPKSNDIGSAIVVVRRNGTILWSWHIWVVDNYPWEPLRAGLASPLPFMNRNLGARYQNTNKSPIYDPNQAGMYYQFGRKDPFHPYDRVPSSSVKVYKSGSDAEQLNQASILGMAATKAFWRMRDFVRDPTAMGFRDDSFTNALEWGPWEYRNEVGNRIWNGLANTTTKETDKRAMYTEGTVKTPFDPSPYGWKVPAIGRESNYAASSGFYPAASGCFPKGNSYALEWITDGDNYSAYSVSTRINVRDINPGIRYEYNTNRMNYDMLKGANPSTAIPVRCRLNEKEADYKRYTEGGFYLENSK